MIMLNRSVRAFALAALPIAGLILSSVAAASPKITAYFTSNAPDGSHILDCTAGVTNNGSIGALARAFDWLGNPVENHASECYAVATQDGTSQDSVWPYQCTAGNYAERHQVTLYTTKPANGAMVQLCQGPMTSDWTTTFTPAANISTCYASRSTKYSIGAGWSACSNRRFDAYSFGGQL